MKSEADKRHHEELKQFREDTRQNNGIQNLGNFKSEDVISAVRKWFHNDEDRKSSRLHYRFSWLHQGCLGVSAQYSRWQSCSQHVKKGDGAKFGVHNRDTTPKLFFTKMAD